MTRRAALVVAAAALLTGSSMVGAQGRGAPPRDPRQPQAAGTAVVRGRILAADTSSPLRRAQVRAAMAGGRGTRLVSTDTDGRFELRDLAAGRWEISASKAGYVTLRYGQRRPFEAGRPIDLIEGQKIEGIDLVLPRGAAITGRIFDEFADPVAGARIQVLRNQFMQGERRLTPVAAITGVSDDTGAFRVYGLMPGDYYVSATLRALPAGDADDPTGYAPTYFPGTGSAQEAQRITVGLGQEIGNISFGLLAVRTARVSGTVVDASGMPLGGGNVALLPAERSGGFIGFTGDGNNRIDAGGRFSISNVPPGNYILMATAGRPRGDFMELGSVPVTVSSEDVTGLTLATSRGATVSGRVIAAPDASGPLLTTGIQVAIQATPTLRGVPSRPVRADANGTFAIPNAFGQGVLRVGGLPQDWTLKSVLVGGADVTDTPVTFAPNDDVRDVRIVVTNRVTDLSGTVVGDDGKPVLEYTVVVFPDDESKWTAPSRFIRSARPDQQGLFRIRALPPSTGYLAVAVDYLEEGEGNDPEFLAGARTAAARVTLGDGESKVVELDLVQR
jgi:hypothetical protein